MTVGPSFGRCHPTPGAGARRQVWLAVGTSKRGRGPENDARVKKLCRFLGFGPSYVMPLRFCLGG